MSDIAGAMFSAPSADGLIGDSDPAFQQHFFNMAQAERKPVIEPDRTGDNLWRETVVLVIGNRQALAAGVQAVGSIRIKMVAHLHKMPVEFACLK